MFLSLGSPLTLSLTKNVCSWCDPFQEESRRQVSPTRNFQLSRILPLLSMFCINSHRISRRMSYDFLVTLRWLNRRHDVIYDVTGGELVAKIKHQ